MRANRFSHFRGALFFCFGLQAVAGTFFSDFNSGLPEKTAVFGDAQIDAKHGVQDSGVLVLTKARANQIGSFIIEPLDGNKPATSFLATFKSYIGGGSSADGYVFHFAPNLPNAAFAENSGSPFMVVFDTFDNGNQTAPGIRVRAPKAPRTEAPVNLRLDHFVDVMIKLDPDGTLDVAYDNELIFTNVPTRATNIAGGFGFGARTGARVDNHFIDDLKIVTQTSPRAFVDTYLPVGNEVSPSVGVEILIRDFKTGVKSGSVRLKVDNATVTPEISTEEGLTWVRYEPTRLFDPETAHTVEVQFVDTGEPAVTNEFSYGFRITSQVYLSK